MVDTSQPMSPDQETYTPAQITGRLWISIDGIQARVNCTLRPIIQHFY